MLLKCRRKVNYRSLGVLVRFIFLRTANNTERQITDITDSFNPSNKTLVIQLTVLKNSHQEKFNKIKELDNEIINLLKPEESEKELEEIIEDSFLLIFAKLDRALSKVPPIESISTLSVKEHTNETRNSSKPVKVKLPGLVIKKFNGNILEWQSFWDQFSSAIHQKDSISDIDKFNYLNSFLCDSVNATIRSLSLTSENYHQVIEMLHERYANPQILISAHMQKFVSLPFVKNRHNVTELRKLFDQVESSVRNLKSLKVETNSYGSLLVPLLKVTSPTKR